MKSKYDIPEYRLMFATTSGVKRRAVKKAFFHRFRLAGDLSRAWDQVVQGRLEEPAVIIHSEQRVTVTTHWSKTYYPSIRLACEGLEVSPATLRRMQSSNGSNGPWVTIHATK